MKILGIDLETTGLVIGTDRITELGYVVWDTELNFPLMFRGFFCWEPTYPVIPKEVIDLNNISNELLMKNGHHPDVMMDAFNYRVDECDAIIAHNGNLFDKPFLQSEARKQDRLGLEKNLSNKIWIDSTTDVPYPAKIKGRNLTYLAAEHGFINPFPHRAVFDVLTMLRIVSNYDWNEVYNNAKEPKVTILLKPDYQEKDLAKARGYRWNAPDKTWRKTVRQSQHELELIELYSVLKMNFSIALEGLNDTVKESNSSSDTTPLLL